MAGTNAPAASDQINEAAAGTFLVSIGINAVAFVATAYVVPGIHLRQDAATVLVVALIFAVVNTLLKPFVELLSCPLVIVTLGLFVLVINGAMLLVTAALSDGRLVIDGWLPAILGGILMAIVSMLLEALLGSGNQR